MSQAIYDSNLASSTFSQTLDKFKTAGLRGEELKFCQSKATIVNQSSDEQIGLERNNLFLNQAFAHTAPLLFFKANSSNYFKPSGIWRTKYSVDPPLNIEPKKPDVLKPKLVLDETAKPAGVNFDEARNRAEVAALKEAERIRLEKIRVAPLQQQAIPLPPPDLAPIARSMLLNRMLPLDAKKQIEVNDERALHSFDQIQPLDVRRTHILNQISNVHGNAAWYSRRKIKVL